MAAITAMFSTYSQCEVGEVEIQMNLYTDGWGYELYWEIVPSGNECGDGTIVSGGNDIDVGCTGGGEQDAQGGNGYPNNSIIEVDPFCLVEGMMYDLIFVDDWGDGGMTFEMYEDGNLSHLYVGGGAGNVWTFEAGNPGLPEYDSPCGAMPIEIDGDAVEMNNETAIAEITEVTPGGGNCGLFGVWCEGGVSNSVWASFTAEGGEDVVITTCIEGTDFDPQVALWSANDCGDWESFSLVSANDDMLGGCFIANFFASELYANCLEEGVTYFIQVDGWAGAVGNVTLNVSSWEGDAALQANVGNIPCALNKGDDGTGFLQPYVIGWGANFTTEWTGPDNYESTDNWIYNLSPGTYTATITDACGEEVLTESWEITMPDPYDIGFAVTDSECPLSANGEIDAMVEGGIGPYTFVWTGPDEFYSEEEDLSGLDAGIYNVTITDSNGCTHVQPIGVEAENSLNFSLGNDTTICEQDDLLLFGPPGYLYEWQDGSVNQFFEVDGEELGFGTYSFILNAYNEEGCEHIDGLIVTIEICDNIEEYFAQGSRVYPNPSNGQFTIPSLPAISGKWELIDALGRVVDSANLETFEGQNLVISTAQSAGLYTLRITDGDRVGQTTLVID